MSETEVKIQGQKPKTSKLAIASLVFGLLGPLSYLAIEIISSRSDIFLMSNRLGVIGFFSWGFAWIPGLLFGVASIGLIKHQEGRLTGKKYANTGLLISTVWVIFGCFGLPDPGEKARIRSVKRILCAADLHSLGLALQIYADYDDDQYPTAEKWCDLLVMYCKVEPRQFVCKASDAKIGESSYAMNKNVVGKKVSEIPEDVVLLFETNLGKNPLGRQELLGNRYWYKELRSSGDRWAPKRIIKYRHSEKVYKYRHSEKVYKLRWNQVGGPEILTTENHKGKGCHVLFNDGHREFVKPERLGELKWEVEKKQ